MIPSVTALGLVREELRTHVLPALPDDEHARSVLVAAIGVLSEVISRVRDDDTWCEASVQRLGSAAATWPQRLQALPDVAAAVAERVERSLLAKTPSDRRVLLLEAAEEAVVGLWAAPSAGSDDLQLLHAQLRELLGEDTELELARAGGRK